MDFVIAASLFWIAWGVLVTPRLFNAIVLFIVFGLLMALAWVQLGAPDVALAEAAIGAGLTGVLLLDTAAHLEIERRERRRNPVPMILWAIVSLLVLLLVAALYAGSLQLPVPGAGVSAHIERELAASGVAHPVTAVLLNFRGYDTLLEIAVLLVAALGVLSLQQAEPPATVVENGVGPVLSALMGVVVPLMLLVAAYLLWSGSHQPGGAFQAGAVLAAAGVLMRLAGISPPVTAAGVWLRFGLVLGFGFFLGVAAAALAHGGLLEYPRSWAGALIFAVESTLTVSIALILATLFAAAPLPRYRVARR